MCGVYGYYHDKLDDEFLSSLLVDKPKEFEFSEKYAIRVTNSAPAIRLDVSGHNKLELMRFGLIPSWSKYEKIDFSTFNARSESIADTKTYAKAYRTRRGLVLAKHFFEFKPAAVDGKTVKIPYCFAFKDRRPFVMAMVWEENVIASDKPIHSFSIVTTEPISVVKPYHHRSPLILTLKEALKWIDPDSDEKEINELMVPASGDEMEAWEVSRLVNNFRNPDGKELIKPAGN
jgi:putative SOS response-associated peptidase YedK